MPKPIQSTHLSANIKTLNFWRILQKELTELSLQKWEIFKTGQMCLKAVKLVKVVPIENHNGQTDPIDPFIGKYQDFEFFANLANELPELFSAEIRTIRNSTKIAYTRHTLKNR